MALIEKLTNIADAIRGKTGGTEKLTLDGMATAIAGMEAGGGGLAYDMGEFVLDADVKHLPIANGGIPHALGEVPQFVVVWTDDFADLSADNVASQNVSLGYVWLHGLTGLQQRVTSAVLSDYGFFVEYYVRANEYFAYGQVPSSVAYMMTADYAATAEKIYLPVVGGNYYYRAGVTYKYFVSKAWWNVGGVANAQ
jgi:hypothetical protein